MKRTLLTLAILALPCLSQAAPPDSTSSGRANSLRAGAWALQFGITSGIDLEEFTGGVSFKWHYSDKNALRFGVDLGGATSNSSISVFDEMDREDDLFFVSVSLVNQRYINPTAEVNFYWGIGPTFIFNDNTRKADQDSLSRRDEYQSYEIGLTAFVGVEWFATRGISLHAEYGGAGTYRSSTSTQETVPLGGEPLKFVQEEDSWGIGTGNVRFGLSAYF